MVNDAGGRPMRVDPHPEGPTPWNERWPVDDLELLARCPACGTGARESLHPDAVDNVLFCAPGVWSYWSCSGCGCAYLDPRPTPDSIQRAYQNYHTHSGPQPLSATGGRLGLVKLALKNGYKNWRFGTDLQPSARWGVALALLVPTFRLGIDREFRHLSRFRRPGRLLDVGFGAGAFLETARLAGWEACGIDPDPEVVANARQRGLEVSCSRIEDFGGTEGTYDLITIAHVVEHVHEPATLLLHCRRLLKPGGTIWLETPNIESLGHARFGKNWRGLEPPRHLVVFNRRTLRSLLQQAGFTDVQDLPQASPVGGVYAMSSRMELGMAPDIETAPPRRLRLDIALARFLEMCLGPSRKEFLAMVATKPESAAPPA